MSCSYGIGGGSQCLCPAAPQDTVRSLRHEFMLNVRSAVGSGSGSTTKEYPQPIRRFVLEPGEEIVRDTGAVVSGDWLYQLYPHMREQYQNKTLGFGKDSRLGICRACLTTQRFLICVHDNEVPDRLPPILPEQFVQKVFDAGQSKTAILREFSLRLIPSVFVKGGPGRGLLRDGTSVVTLGLESGAREEYGFTRDADRWAQSIVEAISYSHPNLKLIRIGDLWKRA